MKLPVPELRPFDGTSRRFELFESRGFAVVESAVSLEQLAVVDVKLHAKPLETAGTRNMLSRSWCRRLALALRAHPLIGALMPPKAVGVQCTLFEKAINRNWLVPFHRDVHIPVRERLDHPSLSRWSEKEGILYVQPPIEVLESLVAVRLHLDDCGPSNGPLKVVPGSHGAISTGPEAHDAYLCVVGRGDAFVMKPLLLHASSKATVPNRRRVLHFLFGPRVLPLGLSWRYTV